MNRVGLQSDCMKYRDVHIEILESHPVIRVGPLKHRLENSKVIPRYQPTPGRVGDTKKDRKLVATNLCQIPPWCNGIDEALWIQEPKMQAHTKKQGQNPEISLSPRSGPCDIPGLASTGLTSRH